MKGLIAALLAFPLVFLVLLVIPIMGSQTAAATCTPLTGSLAGSEGAVRVGTFNTKPHWSHDARRARRGMTRFNAAGVTLVALQELGGGAARAIERMPGWAVLRATPNSPAAGGGLGNGIAYREDQWRVGKVSELVTPNTTRTLKGRNNGASRLHLPYATFTSADGAEITLMSIHHVAGQGPVQRRARTVQQRMSREKAVQLARRGGATIVAGDFNDASPDAMAPMRLAARGGIDLFFGLNVEFDNRRIDRTFKRQGITDHPAAHVEVTLGAPATGLQPVASTTKTVAGLSPEQTRNAATIVQVARKLDVPGRGMVVALAAALQESGLRNLTGGDRDSLGLFQQRPSQGWGSPRQVRDPVKAAMAFFGRAKHTNNTGLLDIKGWESMPITVAAQAVQASGFPDAYADDEALASQILAQLDQGAAERMAEAATAPFRCAPAATQAAAGTCPKTGLPVEEGLTPDALMLLRCVNASFGEHTYGGVGDRAANPESDHPSGRAVDIMIENWQSPSGIAEGDAIAAWLRRHARAFGITYLIWRGQIWSLDRADEGWRAYGHPSGATDPTSRHMDHVHASVDGNAGTGLTGAVTMPLPAGTFTDQNNWHDGGAEWASWHSGNDLSAPCGTRVMAAHSGRVVIETGVSWSGPYLVKITQGQGQLTTWYAHMQAVTVRKGSTVQPGQQIGEVGDRGNSTGCHLHFEVHTAGGPIYGSDNVDPMAWLRANLGGPSRTVPATH